MTDIDTVQASAPLIDTLPGEPLPYYLASGEGVRIESGGLLWTVIARSVDTGGPFDAAFALGPRGAEMPYHSVPARQRSYHVVDGSVQFWVGGESRILVPGDSVHVPDGVPVGYRMLGHLSRLLLFSAPGGVLDALVRSGRAVERHVYSTGPAGEPVLPDDATVHPRPRVDAADPAQVWDEQLPAGREPYFLRSRTGDRLAWPDAVNAVTARGRTTAGRYVAVNTLAAPQPYIIRHFHRLHTENFLCLSGRIWLWVNGTEVLLTPGDFVHAPAGTVHSFAIAAHNTQMLGLLTSDVFERFFDVTGVPTDDHVHTEGLIEPETMSSGMAANPGLDVVVVDGPPRRVRAPGL